MKRNTSESNKASVLIPDGETHLLIYAINCLSQVSDVSIFVLSSSKWNPVRFSRHISKFIYYPHTEDDKKWIKSINDEVKKHKIDVVMPIFEKGIRRILENKEYLDKKDGLVSLPDLETFNATINKWKLAKYCSKKDIPVPKSFMYRPEENLTPTFFTDMEFPVIVKPLEGFGGGMGIAVFANKEDLTKYISAKVHYPIIIQEFIKGYDIDCSILAVEGEILAYTIQKGFLQGDGPYAPMAGIKFEENSELFNVVKKLIHSLKWNGVAHLDLRYDENNKDYKVIELNPRFWGSMDASCLMGVNFPYLLILNTLGRSFAKPTFKQGVYYNLKGLVKMIKKDFFFIRKRKFIMNNTQFRFVVYDMAPTLYKYFDRTKNLLLRRLKKR